MHLILLKIYIYAHKQYNITQHSFHSWIIVVFNLAVVSSRCCAAVIFFLLLLLLLLLSSFGFTLNSDHTQTFTITWDKGPQNRTHSPCRIAQAEQYRIQFYFIFVFSFIIDIMYYGECHVCGRRIRVVCVCFIRSAQMYII